MTENYSDKTTFKIYLEFSFKSFNEVKHFFRENEEMTDYAFSEFKKTKHFKDVIEYNQERLVDLLLMDFNINKTNSSNVYILNTDRFKQFINKFLGNPLIDWQSISAIDNVNWNLEYLERGKHLWNWKSIQLNPKLVDHFEDFEIIEKFSDYLNWDIVSGDKRLKWNFEYVEKFKNHINFKQSISNEKYTNYNLDSLKKCFRNFYISVPEPYKMINYGVHFDIGCLSDNPYLNDEIIIKHSDLWNWRVLSENPCISIDIIKKYANIFDWSSLSSNTAIHKNDSFFYENLHLFSMQTLSYNKSLTIDHLRHLKKKFTHDFIKNFNYIIIINNVEIYFPGKSFWVEVLKRPTIKWTSEYIEEFREILDYAFDISSAYEKHPIKWSSICSKLDKNTIIKYKDYLNIVSVGIENEELIWDIELTGILLDFTKNLKLEESKFSKSLFLEILDTRKFTTEAIKHYRFHWLRVYTYESFHRNSDGTYNEYNDYPIWKRFERNKNIIKDIEFYKLFETTKYNINQVVSFVENFENIFNNTTKAMVVANRFNPYKTNDQKELYPEKDYIIILYNETNNLFDANCRFLDVYEYQLGEF